MISVMHVNNEVGTIMPIEDIYKQKKANTVFHTDAVQAFGKIPLNTVRADIVTVSAHKIHGPKGCGAIAVRKGVSIKPMIFGGGQEKNLRSGTENVAAIAGFGEATSIAVPNLVDRIRNIDRARNFLLHGIKTEIKDFRINSVEETSAGGEAGFCVPSILNMSFLGTRGEALLHALESDGIYVSTGAACSSNKKGMSHVLAAMGLSEKETESAIRFSFSEFNSIIEMDYVLGKLKEHIGRFRKLGSFR
jgi:cysteine desulfurase